jgi:hypothetical protein
VESSREFLSLNARRVLLHVQEYLLSQGITPVVHVELEGCYVPSKGAKARLDYAAINADLRSRGVKGQFKPEYWRNQWEYVSDFAGQTPLAEADFVDYLLRHIDDMFNRQGIDQVLVKPVVWSGDKAKLAAGSKTLFASERRDVHIPNAVQLNISVLDGDGVNLVINGFGEHLQNCLLRTSRTCCLLFLPEEEAFQRLRLKSEYGLEDELCSPADISGGSQGSIALYRQLGKHNQKMGQETRIYNHDLTPLVSDFNWHKTARVEHRLGASSRQYNPYLNILFALLNIADALDCYLGRPVQNNSVQTEPVCLPRSLRSGEAEAGAIELFQTDNWFAATINRLMRQSRVGGPGAVTALQDRLGDELKGQVLQCYQQNIVMKR